MSTPEGPQGLEFYEERYSRITNRLMEGIFSHPDALEVIEDPVGYAVAYTAHPLSDGNAGIYADYIKNTEEGRKIAYGRVLPQAFQYPYIQFEGMLESYTNPNEFMCTTKYGILPLEVIDRNRQEWFIFNVFFFNALGQGLKYEQIRKSDEPPAKIVSLDHQRIRLSYELHEEDSRFVPISSADLGFIEGLLDAYDAGGFSKGEYIRTGKRPTQIQFWQ